MESMAACSLSSKTAIDIAGIYEYTAITFGLMKARLLVLCCLVVCSMPATSEDRLENRAYIGLGLGTVFAEKTRFTDNDRADSGLPKLYGSPNTYTAGNFDAGIQWRAGVGYRFTPALRAQVESGMANSLDYRGNANYRRSGARQPSEAELDTRQFLLAGFYDFPSRKAAGKTCLLRSTIPWPN